MKAVSILFAVLLLLFTQSSSVVAEDHLFPDSLLNWLRIIQCDGFRLVHASDRNGHYFAIYVDKDGDLLIAEDCYDVAQRGKTYDYRVVDTETNKGLHDPSSPKDSPDAWPDYKKVTYSFKDGSSITNIYPTGYLYPLVKGDRKEVRVKIIAETGDRKQILLDEVIQLAKPKETKK